MNLTLERSYPTPYANSTLLPLLLLSLMRQRHTPNASTKIKKEYDYVIVGAGSAGSVVASRLSELPCVNVLLLEAGPKPPVLTDLPAISTSYLSSDLDWQFLTTPQKYTGRAQINRQSAYPSGKVIGGTSILNSMIYVRGNRKDYNDWEAMGAKGWSYRDVFPYFLKLEDNQDPQFLANGYHAVGGPVTVHQPRYHPNIQRALSRAATDIGYKIVDSNAARQTGFYVHQANIRDSQRCSSAKAYLVPAENRTNLDILPNAMVTKIMIHKNRATGVRFDFGGQTYYVNAKREVIISAGTIKTPQLLMLSGVGPKTDLERFNIRVKVDLPVGKNLHNHAGTFIPFQLNPNIPDFGEKLEDPDNIKRYIYNRTGPLGSTSGFNMLAFLKGEEIHPSEDSPNFQLYFFELVASGIRELYRLTPEVYRSYLSPYDNKPLFSCLVAHVQPRSRGTLTLKSKNPYDPPIINPNYLKDPRDVEDLVEGMRTCTKVASNRHLRKLGVKPLQTLMPGCEMYVNDEDNYFRCYLRSFATAIYHIVGTAKMGDPKDPTTVVDTKLRVKNIEGLRVIDASIMPKITSGNSHTPTTMIAEKASDIIKETIYCCNEYGADREGMNRPSFWSENRNDDWKKGNENLWEGLYLDDTNYNRNNPRDEHWIRQEDATLWKKNNRQVDEQWADDVRDITSKNCTRLPKQSSWCDSGNDCREEYIIHNYPEESSWDDEYKQELRDYDDERPLATNFNSQFNDYWKDVSPDFWYRKLPDNTPIYSSWANA